MHMEFWNDLALRRLADPTDPDMELLADPAAELRKEAEAASAGDTEEIDDHGEAAVTVPTRTE
jgi:hypothetical protein